jgi:RNA polymerase primary sigma factor
MANEELVLAYQNGDKEALNKIIENNKGMVVKLVNKFYISLTNSIDREDLEQEAIIGLITAADRYRFDIENPSKFITYAVYWIYEKISRFMKYKNTNEETSLNIPITEDSNAELLDCIESVDYSYENIEDKLYNKQLRQELEEVMSNHNTLKEREILKLHFGWDTSSMSLRDIGEIFNISGQRVMQLETIALRKVRQSKWARLKAKELYINKRKDSIYSIPGTVESISFAERYL